MSEVVQLLPEPDPERDEAIFKAWKSGKRSVLQLSRDYNLPQTQITAIIDNYLPSLTPQAQVRELRRLLFDLEELRAEYHGIAMVENDPEAANVSIRTAHEIAQLRQFVGGGQHSDPIQLTQRAGPGAREPSTAALARGLAFLCGKPVNPPEASPETQAQIQELSEFRKDDKGEDKDEDAAG
jgi:hypothetical protein